MKILYDIDYVNFWFISLRWHNRFHQAAQPTLLWPVVGAAPRGQVGGHASSPSVGGTLKKIAEEGIQGAPEQAVGTVGGIPGRDKDSTTTTTSVRTTVWEHGPRPDWRLDWTSLLDSFHLGLYIFLLIILIFIIRSHMNMGTYMFLIGLKPPPPR